MEIQRKEKQRLIEEEEKRKARLKELNFRIVREFDSNRLTFDPNGKIINLRINNNIESNLGNEFYWSKPAMKDIRTFRHLITKAPRNSFSNTKNKKLVDFAEGIVNQIKSSKKINSSINLDDIDDDEEEIDVDLNDEDDNIFDTEVSLLVSPNLNNNKRIEATPYEYYRTINKEQNNNEVKIYSLTRQNDDDKFLIIEISTCSNKKFQYLIFDSLKNVNESVSNIKVEELNLFGKNILMVT
jgi:hypothetical protein